MTILFTSLSFFVFVVGLIVYFFCAGAFTKATILPIAKIMVFAGLLALLIASGGQLQSCSATGGGGGAAATHK